MQKHQIKFLSHENNHNRKVCEAELILPSNTVGKVKGKNGRKMLFAAKNRVKIITKEESKGDY